MSRWMPAPTLVAAAVMLAGLLVGCAGGEETASSDTAPATDDAALELTVPAAQAGRCMLPNVENLRAQDTAFEGVVTALAEGTATLEVTQSFKGEEAAMVTVAAPSRDFQDLALAVDFEEGQTYLVSSLDNQVSVCGLSGAKDELLAELYQQAYTG